MHLHEDTPGVPLLHTPEHAQVSEATLHASLTMFLPHGPILTPPATPATPHTPIRYSIYRVCVLFPHPHPCRTSLPTLAFLDGANSSQPTSPPGVP